MDIDTPPPGVPGDAVPLEDSSSKEPRLYAVPPSAWRQQQTQQAKDARRASSRKPVPSTNGTTFATNLDDLANVEPIGRPTDGSGGGLRNLADLSSTLPFDSTPAPQPPHQSAEPQVLAIPPVPNAPDAPQRLSKASWRAYAQQFGIYLNHFHKFNRDILTHFDARENQARALMTSGGGGIAWLEATGDGSGAAAPAGLTGFGGYLKGVREDEAVRETWKVGCERHAEAVTEFDRLRERVRKLVAVGALAEI